MEPGNARTHCAASREKRITLALPRETSVDLVITDTHTGRQKTYRNPLSTAFAPILDTQALACWRGGRPDAALRVSLARPRHAAATRSSDATTDA
jgi:hypothetical protein